MSSLSLATCPAPFPTPSTTTAVPTASCRCSSSSSSGTDSTTIIPSQTLSTSTSTETSITTLTSTTGTAVVTSTTSSSASSSSHSEPSCLPPDNQEPSTTDTVELPSAPTSAVSTTSLTASSSSDPCPCSPSVSSPTPRPPLGNEDPPGSPSTGSTTISTTPHTSTSAESPETEATSISLTTTSSTVASSPPVQAPPTATQDTSSTISSTGTVSEYTTTGTGPTRPPPNNGPAPSETSVTTRDRPSTAPDTSTDMSTPRPTPTTTTRRPPPGNAETPVGEPQSTTSSEDAPPTTTSTRTSSTSRPPNTPPPPPGSSTTSRTTTPPPPTSTTTREQPPDTGSETPLPPTDPTTRASSTITSVTTVRQESGVRQTTSTTVTMAPISTFSTPVEVIITDTEDGSVSTTIPPFLTITSTWTQADGSIATETHIVANPPGSPLETEHRGILSRTGATAGIFAAVGVLVSAGLFAAYILWRRRRQANMRRQWIQGMSQQRPDSLGGTYPFGHHPDSPSMGGGGNVASGGIGFGHTRNQSGSRVAPPTPPPGLGLDARDALPWDESRRIPAQRAEMRQRPTATGLVQDATLAGVGSAKYHGRGLSGEQTGVLVRTHSQTHRDEGPAPPPSSYDLRAGTGDAGTTNKNPFAGGILGLKRTGSGSTTDSSTTSTWLNRSTPATLGHGKGKMSISKERISLPVPPPIPSPIRKPAALYDPDELFSNRLPSNSVTTPATTNNAAKQGAGAQVPPSPPAASPTSSNWYQRQSMDHGPSPAPSTPSMYPPTLPADDEMDESEGFDSDATFDRLMQKPVVTEATTSNAEPPKSTYGDVNGYSAFQNLFVVPSRPKPPPPPPRSANRVPPLSIDTAVSALSNRGSSASAPGSAASATTSPVPPRPPRSILRTSNGSLSLGPGPAPAKVRVQSTPEVFPLTPPASTPGHSPHSSYTLPGSPSAILGAPKSSGADPMAQEKVQSILTGRRLMLDRKINERGGSGSD